MLPQRKPHPPELRDGRGRRIRRLRVSLTDLCNLRCRYCMPAAGVNKMRHEDMLRLEELAWLVRVFVVDLGVPRVRVTGGEPLVRRGAVDFLRALGEIRGLRELALTTNACLLAEHARALRAAGVQRVNISLDTLDRERFRSITGSDELHRVLAGVEAAADAGFETVKLNAVVLPETLDEAPALVRFAAARGMVLRFIERMPGPGTAGPEPARHVPARRVMERLRAEFTVTPTDEGRHPGATAKLYHVEGPGLPPGALVGFITPISAPFCRSCDRVRLRGDGRLLPCLSQGAWIDLRPFVRPEPRAGALAEFVRAEMARAKDTLTGERRIEDMWRIGG